jgi:hypothetical protein
VHYLSLFIRALSLAHMPFVVAAHRAGNNLSSLWHTEQGTASARPDSASGYAGNGGQQRYGRGGAPPGEGGQRKLLCSTRQRHWLGAAAFGVATTGQRKLCFGYLWRTMSSAREKSSAWVGKGGRREPVRNEPLGSR